MLIPVYKNYWKQVSNLCYCVTDLDIIQENQDIPTLRDCDINKNDTNSLCNVENADNKGMQPNSNAVTQVTLKNNRNKLASFEPDDWLDYFEERAAIYEYENNDSRFSAEVKAMDDCIIKFLEVNKEANLDMAVKTLMSFGLHNPFYKE